MKALTRIALLAAALAIAGCNTVEGVGKDLQNAGKAISNASEKQKNSPSSSSSSSSSSSTQAAPASGNKY